MLLRRYASFFFVIPVVAFVIVLSGLIPGTSISAHAQACGSISFPYTLPDNAPATLVTAIECANANGTADIIDLNGFTVPLLAASPYAVYQAQTGLPQITSDITLRDGTIQHDLSGGGFLFRTFDITSAGTLSLQNMTLLGDSAPNPGGAFYNLGTVNVTSSTITGYSTNNRGGVLYNGSGATANFINALLYDNNAVNAHVMDNLGSVNIINSTFDKHTSISNFGFILEGSGYVIRNSILWNPGSGPGQISAGNTVSDSIVKSGYSGGTNILNTDQLFVDEDGNDFRLQLTSPAVNAGADIYVPADTTDIDGDSDTSEDTPDRDLNPRIVGLSVDMGAFERQDAPPDPCLAISFPYTLPDNAPATLITAIECANDNGTADVINLNGQTVTLTASYGNYTGATGLPQVTTNITLENGTLSRDSGAPQFRLMAVSSTGNLTLDGITVSGGSLSSIENAGAISNDGGTLNILNSTVTNNSAGFGGAIYNSTSAATITIINSQLTGNSATQNSGFLMNDSGSATITGSTVSGNSSSGASGNGAISSYNGTLTVIDSTFSGNTTTSSVGAVQNFAGTVNIANSVFTGNSATTSTGAVLNNAAGVMTITNSLFSGNSAGSAGGALYNNVSSTLTITNSTIASNNATTSGGIHISGSSTLTITNSILWGNSSNTLTGATITHSVIEGGFAGPGNLNVDPLFVAPVAFASAPTTTGNYRLQDNSPAVDAGSNAAVPVDTYDLNDNASTTDEAPDLDGNPRRYDDTGVADTGSGTAPIVDMGAYEKQTNSPSPLNVDYCNLQFPASFTAASNSTSPVIYGRIYEDDGGILTSNPGAHPSVVGQLGYGPLGSDPRNENPAWLWFPTTYNVQVGNDDEYEGTFTVPFAPTNTQLSYTYRFTIDNASTYVYCDTDGNGINNGLGFSTANLGTLTISPGGQPTISINDVTQVESNSGTTNFNFTVSLNGPSLSAVTFDISTANNTATVANSDYVANSQTGFAIPAGQTDTAFTVVVNGDTTFEPNETFFVNVTNVVGATVADGQGTGTITNDDVDPCAAYIFPYTMTGSTPAELIQAIQCANLNGASADTIDLNGQTITLTASYANVVGTNIGLPQISTPMTIQNGTITRSSADLFRFFYNLSTLTLNNLTLSNADSQGDGGVILNGPSSVLNINNSRIVGNYGNFGGAIFNSSTGTTTLTNTLVSGNRSNSQGGGIRNRGTLILNNSTVAGNFTTSGSEGGGGIANAGTYSLTLNNSLVYGNESSSFPAANEMVGVFTSNNSLVGVNPSFVNLLDAGDTAPITGGDYRLADFSAAIDAGNNSLIPGGVTTDLADNSRRVNDTGVADTGTGTAPIVDIGAYEKQTNSVTPEADLSITKTDGVSSATPGGSVTYTITASNAGPSNVPSATVADTFPAILTGTWTCVGAGGGTCTAAGSGNISDTVNLPTGGSVTYTVTATISASATGTLSNTATVTSGVTDPNPANNSATDTAILTTQADLSITKTDGVSSATPGGSVTYTITASNAGPSNVPSATVADTFPAILTGTWTCVGAGGGTCTAAGAGNINETVNLPVGGSVTYTVSATISAAATGTLSNTATVSSAVTDPIPGNNSATDTDTLGGSADLSITKTDGVTTATPGGSVTYTITASNAGPSNAPSATVADTFPAILTGTWTCVGAGGGTCTAAGAGNINDTVNLPVGGSVTYTVSATISAAATGTLSNTATVSSGVTDPNPANNSATDTDTLGASADLSITKTDGVTTATPGGSVTYTITASNAGPSNVPGATVADTFPAILTGTWTCVGAGGGTCTTAGAGNISDTVNLPAGGSVTYTFSATISAAATGTLSNTATVSSGVTDPNPANNSATDTDTLGASADLSITKTDGVTTATPGGSVTYTITASNAGPSDVTSATVADTFPVSITGVTWTCVSAGGGTCTAAGAGNIGDTVNLPVGGSVTYTATGTIDAAATGTLSNTATVSSGVTDPNPANNSATDEDTINPLPVTLLKNGGFETAGGKAKNAKRWKAEAPAVTDKRICRPAIAFEGSCAYRFHFNGTIVGGGGKRAIVQKILSPGVGAGDTLDFSFYARTSNLTIAGRARVIVYYSGGSKQIIKLMIPAGSSPYTLYAGSVVLTGTPTSITVMFEPRRSKGTMFVDGASLTATASTRSIDAADVLPVPEAPEGFRR